MKSDYELILGELKNFQVISGQEYPWIYIPEKDKKFRTGLYYFPNLEDEIRKKSGKNKDRSDEEVKPFFMVKSFLHGGDMSGDIWSLEKAVHYLAEQGADVIELEERVMEIMVENSKN